MDMTTVFHLTPAEVKTLNIPNVGEGGFQAFGRSLQAKLRRHNGTISLTDEEIGRIFRYAAYARSDGGFQGRCRKIFGRVLAMPFMQQPGLPGVSDMPEFTGLPVHGYRPQDATQVDLVNANKIAEERCLRMLDDLKQREGTDQRMLAIGRTQMEQAWMWVNRAIFKPSRAKLPEDAAG